MFGHISDEICSNLHWCPVRQRITYKFATSLLSWLVQLPNIWVKVCQYTSSAPGCQHLCCALRNDLLVSRISTVNYGARWFLFWTYRLGTSLHISVHELYDKPEQFKKVLETFLIAAVASASVDPHQKWHYIKFFLMIRYNPRIPFKNHQAVPEDIVLVWKSACFEKHVCQNCYFQLRLIRRLGKALPVESKLLLVHALVHSRLDDCNSVGSTYAFALVSCPAATVSVEFCCSFDFWLEAIWSH